MAQEGSLVGEESLAQQRGSEMPTYRSLCC